MFTDEHFDYFETIDWDEYVSKFKQAAQDKWDDLRCGYNDTEIPTKKAHFFAKYKKNKRGVWMLYKSLKDLKKTCYAVDYVVGNTYKIKYVFADSPEKAIKKARVKAIDLHIV